MKKLTKAMAAIMLMTAVIFVTGCKPEDDPNNDGSDDTPTIVDNGGNGTLNGHDYIDLGLPSGTLWATCNVGSSSPTGAGDYLAWAETIDKSEDDHNYDWLHYKFSAATTSTEICLTKYCNKAQYGNNGFTDELTTLQPSDDAATVRWGEGWMTPSAAQWKELMEVCTGTRTYIELYEENKVEGYQFTSPNGESIFLPMAGRHQGDGWFLFTRGEYWTNELHDDYPTNAKIFGWTAIGYSNEDDFMQSGCLRHMGISVRPVCMAH